MLRLRGHHLEALEGTDDERHGEGLGEGLGAHVVAQVIDHVLRTGNESADGGHGLGEGAEVDVDLLVHALLVSSAAAILTDRAESVGVVHEESEPVFLLVLDDLGELALVAGHAEHAFGHDEDAATGLGGEGTGTVELLDKALHVVVVEDEALALVQADAVDHAGVALAVIDNDIVAADEGLNGALATLVTVVQEEGVFLLHELGELVLQLLVVLGLAAHDAGPHRVAHAPLLRRLGVHSADVRMVGEAEVVVDAPHEDLLAPEGHPVGDVALQLREGEVAMGVLGVLAKRSAVAANAIKNVQNVGVPLRNRSREGIEPQREPLLMCNKCWQFPGSKGPVEGTDASIFAPWRVHSSVPSAVSQ